MLACVQSIIELQHTFLYFRAHVQMQYCGKHLSPYVVSNLLDMWLVCHFQLSEIELNCVSIALYIIPHDVICVYLKDRQSKSNTTGKYIIAKELYSHSVP
jgi:hypothetical protein